MESIKRIFKSRPEIGFLAIYSAFIVLLYIVSWRTAAVFLGMLTATLLDPVAIIPAVILMLYIDEYRSFLGWTAGAGLFISLAMGYWPPIHLFAVLLLANLLRPARQWVLNELRSAPTNDKKAIDTLKNIPEEPEDTDYYVKNVLNKKP